MHFPHGARANNCENRDHPKNNTGSDILEQAHITDNKNNNEN